MKRFLPRPTYANVVSTLCLFLLLGGTSALAATQLAHNSVGPNQLQKNAVRTGKIAAEAVKAGKLAQNSVTTNRLRDGSVSGPKIVNEAVGADQLAKNAVTAADIANNAVTTPKINKAAVIAEKIAANAVTNEKLANNVVTAAKLATILTVQNTLQIAPGAEGTVDVACPVGSVMLSGGGYWTTGANNLRTTLKQGNGWRVEGKNTLAGGAPLTVQAYCLTG
jgi:hypothetical protein